MPGKDIGYIRVSSHDQNTARQLDGVHLDKVFEEHASGKNSDRPALQTCLDYVRDGDTLHVHSIDRLARNLQDLLSIVTTLKEKGVTVTFHKEKLEFVGNGTAGKSDAFQELQLHIIAAVAQFERALILERQREGIAIAKREGKYKNVGRKPTLSDEQEQALQLELQSGAKIAVLARKYGISRQTLYNVLAQK
ncbi:recombinase family protein [Bilophila wadsworthia]|uniref:recombinase family protein n=1 Tax=Bilophila wadsworthia TaxID=35833 RepID=UPI00266D69EC|nr:recombinase family protein [Bilophila wadsworthia]